MSGARWWPGRSRQARRNRRAWQRARAALGFALAAFACGELSQLFAPFGPLAIVAGGLAGILAAQAAFAVLEG